MAKKSATGFSPCGNFKLPGAPPSVRRHPRSLSERAGIHFPVERIHYKLKQNVPPGNRPTKKAAVYMATVLEYLTTELIDLSGIVCHSKGLDVITLRHIQEAIKLDDESDRLVRETIQFTSESSDYSDDPDEHLEDFVPAWPVTEPVAGSSSGQSAAEEDLNSIRQGCAAMEAAAREVDKYDVDVPD